MTGSGESCTCTIPPNILSRGLLDLASNRRIVMRLGSLKGAMRKTIDDYDIDAVANIRGNAPSCELSGWLASLRVGAEEALVCLGTEDTNDDITGSSRLESSGNECVRPYVRCTGCASREGAPDALECGISAGSHGFRHQRRARAGKMEKTQSCHGRMTRNRSIVYFGSGDEPGCTSRSAPFDVGQEHAACGRPTGHRQHRWQ